MKKGLVIILDGLGDHPIKDLGNKTPLEAAKKPNINKLVRKSECGLIYPLGPGIIPGSDTSHLTYFGYSLKYYPGRGVFEALGFNIELKEGDIAFRVNIGTVDNNRILIDRRAGRNDYGIDKLIEDFDEILKKISDEYGIEAKLLHGVEHRGVLILRGLKYSNVTENDEHKDGVKIEEIKAKDEKSKETAEILNKIINSFYEFSNKHEINKEREEKGLLKANYLLIRGKGIYKELEENKKFYKKYKISSLFIAGAPMYLGVAKYVGMDVYKPIGATGKVNTSLFSKAEAAISNRNKYDLIFIHVKATDSLSHDGKYSEKKKFIERVDNELISRIKDEFDLIVITGDHTTSSLLKRHTSDPVPILVYSENCRYGNVKDFGERKCSRGNLGRIYGRDLIKIILDKLEKGIMIGT